MYKSGVFCHLFLFLFYGFLYRNLFAQKCAYLLGQKNSSWTNHVLAQQGIVVTIDDDKTYKYEGTSPEECFYFASNRIIRPHVWYIPNFLDYGTQGCCEGQRLRCQRSRKTDESVIDYVERVQKMCTSILGWASYISCRFDVQRQRNVINRLILVSVKQDKPQNIHKWGCESDRAYELSSQVGTEVNINGEFFVNTFAQDIYETTQYLSEMK